MTTVYKPLASMEREEIHETLRQMERQGTDAFAGSTSGRKNLRFECSADMRYRGQGHDIRVALPGPTRRLQPDKVVRLFNEEYRRTYGYLEEEENIQVINLRVVASLATKKPTLEKARSETKAVSRKARKGERPVYFTERGEYVETRVLNGHLLRPGNLLRGPAIIELETTTIVLRPEQRLRVDPYGNFIAARRGVRP